MLKLFHILCLILDFCQIRVDSAISLSLVKKKGVKADFYPPSFVSYGPRLILFKYKDPFVLLECVASGSPKVSYSWKKGNHQLEAYNLGHVIRVEGSLNITRPSVTDEGFYRCLATNLYGTAVSDIMQLRMAYQNLPPRSEEPRIHRVFLRTALILRCRAPNGYPRPQTFWIKPEDVGGRGRRVETSERLFQDNQGSLHFANVRAEDAGNYSCLVMNPFIRSLVQVEDQVVDVLEEPYVEKKPPSILKPRLVWSSPIRDVALAGYTHSLRCFFSGFPTPAVDWTNPAGRFNLRTTIKSFGHVLEISNVSAEDQGLYHCSASSGNFTVTQIFNLTVETNPMWSSVSMKNTEVDEESSAEVYCDVTGEPKPDITWSINGRPLREFPRSKKRLVGHNYIKYINASQLENQVIQCNASNRHGYLFANAFIKVVAQAPKFSPPLPSMKKISQNSTLVLICNVISSPKAEIAWYKTPSNTSNRDYSNYTVVRKVSLLHQSHQSSREVDKDSKQSTARDINNSGSSNATDGLHSMIGARADDDVIGCGSNGSDGRKLVNCTDSNCTLERSCYVDNDRKKLYVVFGDAKTPDIFLDFVDFEFELKHFLPSPTSKELVIKGVDVCDSAFYHCHARNKFGTNTTSTLVVVTNRTRILTKPSDQTVNAMDSVEFSCKASTDDRERANLVIKWFKVISDKSQITDKESSINNKALSPHGFINKHRNKILLEMKGNRISTTEDSLVIRGVKISDTGQYLCHANNGIDFDEATALLTVRGRPSAPKNATTSFCSDSSASLTWERADENNSPILKYHVYCFHETKFMQEPKLSPSNNPTNKEEQSDAPPSVFLGPTQYFYRCAVVNGRASIGSKKVSVNLSLTPFAVHQFRVAAVNSLGEGPRIQADQSCETAPSRPFRNPIGVCTDLRNCSQLIIVWQPLQKNELNAEGFHYLVSYQQINISPDVDDDQSERSIIDQFNRMRSADQSVNGSHAQLLVQSRSLPSKIGRGEEETGQVKRGWKSAEAVITTADCSFKKFLVYVQSVNDMGLALSQNIDVKIGYSGEGKPSVKPKNLRIDHEKLVGNSVELFWDPVETDPTAINGIFKGYQIHAWLSEDPAIKRIQEVVMCRGVSSLACSSSSSNIARVDSFQSDALKGRTIRDHAPVKYILSDLWPNSLITLGILVASQTQLGDLSDPIEFMTLDAPVSAASSTSSEGLNYDNGDEKTKFYEYHDSTVSLDFISSKVPKVTRTSSKSPFPPGMESTNETIDYFHNDTFIYYENGDVRELTTLAPPKREEYKRIPIGSPKLSKWFIGMSSAIGLLFVLLVIVCIIKRQKGRRYHVHHREKTKGRELDWPNVRENKENIEGRRRFAIGRLIKKKSRVSQSIESDTSSLKEYEENGDMTTFLEDGSFIGQYCSKPILELPKTDERINASVLATYI